MHLVAVVGPTASGKSALGLVLAERFEGEVVSCDSTAVYRGVDIGTDKLSDPARRGVPHHLIDVVEPTAVYSAAQYAADAAAAVRDITHRGRLPVLVGGTGFYYRALVRGVFPGPGRDTVLRGRLERVAARRGVESLHRWLARADPASARRIQPRDRRRVIRALEVYLLTGRPMTEQFAETVSPLPAHEVLTIGLRVSRDVLRSRVAHRVDAQFARGLVDEVRQLMALGVPTSAHAFSGLVYRQVLDLLAGVRDEAATRKLIVQENMRYAKRQLTWFNKESGIHWLDASEGVASVAAEAVDLVRRFTASRSAPAARSVAVDSPSA